MKRILLAVVILALAGCFGQEEKKLGQDIAAYQKEQEAISKAIHRIEIVHGATVKGRSDFAQLGPVQGFCFNIPNSTGGQTVHGDGIRAAAYRKYGDQVDAIVNTSVWFVPDDASDVYEPYTENGYFECGGTAVHFNSPAPAGAATPSMKPPSPM